MQVSHRSMKIPRVHNTRSMVQSVLANVMALEGSADSNVVDDDLYIMGCCAVSLPGTHRECFDIERLVGSCWGTACNCGTVYHCGSYSFLQTLSSTFKPQTVKRPGSGTPAESLLFQCTVCRSQRRYGFATSAFRCLLFFCLGLTCTLLT